MAEIRHLENRHDVIFFCQGWSDLDKILQTGTEGHMSTAVMCKNGNQMKNSNMADVWANSMACHPRATYDISGCCHLVNSLSRFQSHMPHCRVQSPEEINVVIVPHCRCKNSIRHIENRFSAYFFYFFLFLMQFRL